MDLLYNIRGSLGVYFDMTGKKLIADVAFLLLFMLVFVGCADRKLVITQRSPEPSPTASPEKDKRDLRPIHFKGTSIQSRDGRRNNWKLSASEITYDRAGDSATAEVVEVAFFDPRGKTVVSLSASGAVVDMKEKSMKFRGAVTLKSADGDRMVIQKLRWDNDRRLLIGEGRIRITRKDSVMTAEKMLADPEMKKVTLSGNVKAHYPSVGKLISR